ncbi:MAG TPA: bifunctional salicylyl-CoA 5-hydroxylase/oxidoreductase [Acidimicrobiales bacterium]|nr:bifunctional salicylyl-CoA 5-hydroxylase/oxidoreductase [Acidimicrobiales bacterium]
MRMAVIGGGPGGLYFAILARQLGRHEVTVYERNGPDETFGFGIVLSDETLGGIEHADPVVYGEMESSFARWDDIDVHYKGRVVTSGGHGFSAMSRQDLLAILRRRAEQLGVTLRFRTEAGDVALLAQENDLVVAADGRNSQVRWKFVDVFRPAIEERHCRYMWLALDRPLEAFEFHICDTQAGVMQVHAYPFSARESTFIVEMQEDVWRRAGFPSERQLAPGESDDASIEKIAGWLQEVTGSAELRANNSQWLRFATVRCESWRHGNIVLIGDAAHTAHFSIGSGTKLTMEDALALAASLHEQDELAAALAAYEEERRPVVLSTQRAAQASLEWFENLHQYLGQEAEQFAVNILTRSRRITYDNLRLRDPEFVDSLDAWFAPPGQDVKPPMFQPFDLGGLRLKNRVVVSPMDMYSAVEGVPGDFHLAHLGSKALGGAGLVMTEMICVSPSGRITPGCAGLYDDEQQRSWQRIVSFVHDHSTARIGAQLGHSGRKGSTRLMWEGMDEPLLAGNWPVVGPSALPYSTRNQVPRQLSIDELGEIKGQFVASARRAAAAGFDLLELHCAHGYLLSSFISPLTNQRQDAYGGSLGGRLHFPLEVFDAVRAVWPSERPLTVRISASDWHPDGLSEDDSVGVALAFAEHGAAAVDVSTGQVVSQERPAYGRSYQTPFADRIRNEVGVRHSVAVIAVGAISSYDDVNSIILAGRADLVALGRAHLYDPHWTLHAAAEQGVPVDWPLPFRAGSRRPQVGRTDGPRPRLELLRPETTKHRRWRPGTS